jgi:hypothetical protein
MRSKLYSIAIVMAALLTVLAASTVDARDYESRFIRNYPPGYHGMWYYTQRFFHQDDPQDRLQDKYRWDLYMSRITNVTFPYLPVPYGWEYGTVEDFNLPDYNSNDWR